MAMKIALFTSAAHVFRAYSALTAIGYEVQPFTEDNSLDDTKNHQLGVSFLYHKKIPIYAISHMRYAINFHPAPLPKYRGFAVYNFGILNRETEWGCTAHLIEEKIDTGDIIQVNTFDMPANPTAKRLRDVSHTYLLSLMVDVMQRIYSNRRITTIKQKRGKYYSKKDMEKQRRILPDDDPALIDRKIRAFWCPPHEGAYIELGGQHIHVINKQIMEECR